MSASAASPEATAGPSPETAANAWAEDASRQRAEEGLMRLAAALAPLRRIQAALAERLTATRAYERLGFIRLRDYARERPGLSARQLQELARVHRRLAELPALERACVANRIPWSKVRLVSRVATPEDEESWIARAAAVSTRQLEADVRGCDPPPCAAEEDDEPRVRLGIRCAPAARERWSRTREMAERVDGRRLSAGQAFEVALAEASSTLGPDPDAIEVSLPERRGRSGPDRTPPDPRAPVPELPRPLLALAAGLEQADARALDRRLCRAVRLEQTLDAAMAPLLRVVTAFEYEWRGPRYQTLEGPRYQTLEGFARNQLGISPTKARLLARLDRAGEVCPELREAYRSGRLSTLKAQCLLPLLLLDVEGAFRPIWVAWAQRVTLRRLERDVERALLLRASTAWPAWERVKHHPERAQDPLSERERRMCAHEVDPEATEALVLHVPREVAALYLGVRAALRARLHRQHGRWLREGECFEALLDLALHAWTQRDPAARRPDPVIERDGYACAVPGCTSRSSLHDHHIVFRSHQGSDAPWNRITLCAAHHQRCLHARFLRIRGRAPDGLTFELGVQPGAPPLAVYRSGDVLVCDTESRRAA